MYQRGGLISYLVTGAGGSIGSAIVKLLDNVIAVDSNESALFRLGHENIVLGDIKKPDFIKYYRPFTVIHAAAYKHVPYSENNIEAVIENNITGTAKLLNACVENNVQRFLFISTDKAAQPCSVLGLTKALGEKLVMAKADKMKVIALRFGNILNSNGSVMEVFSRQKKEGLPLTVCDKDCRRFFIEIDKAANLIINALDLESGIYVIDCGKSKSIDKLARSISNKIVYTGLRPGEKLEETMVNVNEILIDTKIDLIKKVVLKEGYQNGT